MENQTLQAWATIAIAKHWEKTISHEALVIKDTDPEELHQMRVGMRRLRSAISGFANVIILPSEAQPQRIGKIAGVLGALRDLDVMREIMQQQYLPHLPAKEVKRMGQVLEKLEKEREFALEDVREVLHGKRYQMLKQSLSQWLETPKFAPIGMLPITAVLPDLLVPEISGFFLHSGWLIGTKFSHNQVVVAEEMSSEIVEEILENEGSSLHDLRKVAKRVRYQIALFTEFYGEKYETYQNDIKSIQECLGEIQDSMVLGDFIKGFLDEDDLAKVMPKLSVLLAESRWESWQNWQKLQKKYLQSQTRREFHQELLEIVDE